MALDVAVTLDGAPAVGALIQIAQVMPAPWEAGSEPVATSSYFTGATDGGGRCQALLKVPTAEQEVDLVVQVPGASGPYSIPELEFEWGPFAPSSRTTVPLEELDAAAIALFSN